MATYTVLITVLGREPADEQALADRLARHLMRDTIDGARFAVAQVDAFEGDHLGTVRVGRGFDDTNRGIKAARKVHEAIARATR